MTVYLLEFICADLCAIHVVVIRKSKDITYANIIRCNGFIDRIIFFPPTYSRVKCNLIVNGIKTDVYEENTNICMHSYKIKQTLRWKPSYKLSQLHNSHHECILFLIKSIYNIIPC